MYNLRFHSLQISQCTTFPTRVYWRAAKHIREVCSFFAGHSVGSHGSKASSGGQRDWSYWVRGGVGVTSYIWHSTVVHAELPPFSALPGIWLAPFFNKKYMNDPIFSGFLCERPHFLTSWYMHIFFAQRFFEAACSLDIQWIDCDICLTTSNKWVQ